MAADGGSFLWETPPESLSHIPRFGDILVTLADSDAVCIKFWESCDSGPRLSSFRGAWVLSIEDMRTVFLENAGADNGINLSNAFRGLCVYKWERERDAWMCSGGWPKLVSLPSHAGLGCIGKTKPSNSNISLVFRTADGSTGTPTLDVDWWNVAMPIGDAVILGVWDQAQMRSDMIRRRLSCWIGGRGVPWTKEGPTYQCIMRKSEFDNRIEIGPVL